METAKCGSGRTAGSASATQSPRSFAVTAPVLTGYVLGVSGLGGLLAGVSLASTRYREAISARLAPLRDFLLLFFFIGLGSRLDLSNLGEHAAAAAVFSVFVLIGNPLIVLLIMSWMGYTTRTGFLAGLTVAQISEFSLIFMAMGLTLGHVDGSAPEIAPDWGPVLVSSSLLAL